MRKKEVSLYPMYKERMKKLTLNELMRLGIAYLKPQPPAYLHNEIGNCHKKSYLEYFPTKISHVSQP